MAAITLRVNGSDHTVDAPEDMPLLWVVRDMLGLTGAKYSCGIGQCGSCTVLLDGRPVRSCRTPVSAVGERAVTTLEGLSPDGSHPVQRAWIAEEVPQCGYCQTGHILAAASLLETNPTPTDEDIDRALTGICRCGTYDRIRKAVHRAAQEA